MWTQINPTHAKMKTVQINPALGTWEDMVTEVAMENYKLQRYGDEPPLCQYADNRDKLTDLIYYFFHRARHYPIN